ncbi:NUDIX hydrolase [Niabella hibiscisoli]|uniref:hypothetical protein n=1 Tax=Niabella hibiscisoli TaxID=1825928 RepID=UPI001F0DB5D4|nr:hypothetical protein [Niabella hibiscisoli]MCH5720953.1 hypothetical protein [Niabella hibiscisoli]
MSEVENPWKVTGSKNVYSNPWISLTEFDVINPGGGKGIYGKVHFKNAAVGVIALDTDMNTYLVGQFRFALDAYSWEIPEGGCPEGGDLPGGCATRIIRRGWIDSRKLDRTGAFSSFEFGV